MFERILLTTDFSRHSLRLMELTIHFARSFGSEILLLHVDEEEQLFPLRSSDVLIRFFTEVAVRREAAMEQMARRIAEAGVRVIQLRAKGIASEEVLHLARAREVDLIAISTIGVETVKQTLIGSTAKQVLRHSPCSVLITNPFCNQLPELAEAEQAGGELPGTGAEEALAEEALVEEALVEEALVEEALAATPVAGVGQPREDAPAKAAAGEAAAAAAGEDVPPEELRPSAWPPIRRVLSPLKLEQHTPEALRFAYEVARSFAASLELLYVLKVPTFFPGLPGEAPLTLPREGVAPFAGEAAVQLASLASEMAPGRVDGTVTIAADEAEEIAAYARRSKADLLIMPRRAGSAVGELLFGRVSAAVAKTSPVPLLLYVPPAHRQR